MKGFGEDKHFKQNIKKKEVKLNPFFQKAIEFHLKGNLKEAIKYYEYCIKGGLKDSKLFSNYAITLRSLGKLNEALNYFQLAIKLKPNDTNVLYNFGATLNSLGKFVEAEVVLQKTLKLRPDHIEAHNLLAFILFSLRKEEEAESLLHKAIKERPNHARTYHNLASILKASNKLKQAELFERKAIELEPEYAEAIFGLGTILQELGDLKQAENCYLRTIETRSNYVSPYYELSKFKKFQGNKNWQIKLFDPSFLTKREPKDLVNIYFARANILHKRGNFKESAKCLKIANDTKLKLIPSKANDLIRKSRILIKESNNYDSICKKESTNLENIFIVGMPRSGSTLCESIISMNEKVQALGEVNIFEEAFFNWREINESKNTKTINDIYLEKIDKLDSNHKIRTIKWLYNYQYIGLILKKIPNSKIIHCFRNPLDNLISIYQANFQGGIDYSSSLVDCAKVFLDHELTTEHYKNENKSFIYDFNYDELVKNPNIEIKKLIDWIGWRWDEKFLSPHRNLRPISTRSTHQVRSPINSNSTERWKRYSSLLKPAIEVFNKDGKYLF